jgi:hypothetical protein
MKKHALNFCKNFFTDFGKVLKRRVGLKTDFKQKWTNWSSFQTKLDPCYHFSQPSSHFQVFLSIFLK